MERSEAIEIVRRNYPHVSGSGTQFETALRTLIPELKESEDERIRKALIELVRKHCVNETRCIMERWLEKQGSQNLANSAKSCKDEPKFKVGDFIVNDYCMGRVIEITNDSYLLDTGQGILFSCHSTRLWDITKDAKDGDVLLSFATPEGDKECPFIFKEIDKSGIVRYHTALLQSEILKIADGITNVMGYANAGYHIPATKEQRDLLFQKMKEAGYEWDAEKKELKKIEQKPAWSENDEEHVNSLLKRLEGLCRKEFVMTRFAVNEDEDWLKALKERYTWKPSDEQMDALYTYIYNPQYFSSPDPRFDLVESVYKDLKKLTE